ncbi:MAG: electron transport complex subunit RsxG [Gammaproteobacteria bacterium]|nr:MAG: electron transport complex subunit RsxG [Gammaproteobacteria bacterium]
MNNKTQIPGWLQAEWLRPGWTLGLFAVATIFLLALTYDGTRDRIAAQERARLEASLKELLVPGSYDNDPVEDIRYLQNENKQLTVYRARLSQQPVTALIKTAAPDGYNGSISLLIGIRNDGDLSGVRVITHRETPGLGDEIELRRSDWLLGFNDRSLNNPSKELWAVKKDGGIFDAFTGATITPRAVVGEIKRTLIYFNDHRDELFE